MSGQRWHAIPLSRSKRDVPLFKGGNLGTAEEGGFPAANQTPPKYLENLVTITHISQ